MLVCQLSNPVLNDFPTAILDDVAHRPWPLPDGPWIMTQSWHDVLFAHWPVAAGELRRCVPAGLHLDVFDGQAWLGVLPFHMTNVAPRGLPAMPWVSAFPELNVRTYVTVDDKPGIYFFSLDAASSLAVAVARALFHLPYFTASMHVQTRDEWVEYESRRTVSAGPPAEFRGRYRPVGPLFRARRGTLEYFLTERYCLYTVDDTLHLRRLEIHHPPWPLRSAEAALDVNTVPSAGGVDVPSVAPLLHFAKRQDTVAWPMRRVD